MTRNIVPQASFRRYLAVLWMIAAAMCAAGLVVLFGAGPAEGAFPGKNGRIVFEASFDVWTMNPDGTGKRNLTGDLFGPSDTESEPTWSPRATKIAFTSNSPGNREIYVMNADGSGLRRLTRNAATDDHPAWSPDGTKIAFHSFRSGKEAIHVLDLADRTTRRLTSNFGGTCQDPSPGFASVRDPAWSPDGRSIAVAGMYSRVCTNTGLHGIFTVDATTGAMTAHVAADSSLQEVTSEPNWSPNGTKIAFDRLVTNGPNKEIFSVNSTGGTNSGLVNLTKTVDRDEADPAWSPDGTRIAHTCFLSGGGVCVMNSDGSGTPRHLTGNLALSFKGNPDWGRQPPPPPDTTKPTITRPRPAPGSSIRDRTPTVSAIVRDNVTNLAKKHIKLFLDGEPKGAFTYSRTTDRLAYESRRLPFGIHTVKVIATDARGNRAIEKWSFRVVRP